MNRIFLMIALFALGTATLFAQPQRGPQPNPELKAALHAYLETEVMPVLTAARNALDQQLSAADKQEIEALRAEKDAFREEKQKRRPEGRPQRDNPPTEAERQAFREMRRARHEFQGRLMDLADANEAALASALEGIRPQAEQWREDLQAIMERFRPADAPDERPAGRHGRNGHPGPHQGQASQLRRVLSPEGFLLFDPSQPLPGAEAAALQLKAFPNPAFETGKLSYAVETPGTVIIQLVSVEGDVVQTLLETEREAGSFTETFDLSEVEPGLYVYRVATPDGIATRRVRIE
jgi:hypothetical protein